MDVMALWTRLSFGRRILIQGLSWRVYQLFDGEFAAWV
jgi:hypothetical protein